MAQLLIPSILPLNNTFTGSNTFTGTVNAAAVTITGNLTLGSTEGVGTGTLYSGFAYVSQNLEVGRSTASSYGIELGNSAGSGTTPYFDFKFGRGVGGDDYNIRIINSLDGTLDVFSRTGTATLAVTGILKFSGDHSGASGTTTMWHSATGGLVILGTGSTNDISIANTTGGPVIEVPTGTLNTVFYGNILTPASTTSIAGLTLPHGTAPSSPTNGDMWTTTAGVFIRINGVTKTFTTT